MAEPYRHRQPVARIVVDGQDISSRIRPRLESLTLTDNRGLEADQLDLVLDDSDGRLAIPRRGAVVNVHLGFDDELVDKGSFVVDELEHAGAPDKLTIRARSADLREGLANQVERSWHGATVESIVRAIAKRHKLSPMVGTDLAREAIKHLDQTGESDLNLLTRLARQFDAVATVKAGRLLMFRAGQGVSASGKPLAPVLITRASGDQHRFAIAEFDGASVVVAAWHNAGTGQRGEVRVDAKNRYAGKVKGQRRIEESGDRIKRLRHIYATEATAVRGARAAWDKLQRGVASLGITLAVGRPEIIPETPASVLGFKLEIDASSWIVTRVVHSMGSGGLTSALELELMSTAE